MAQYDYACESCLKEVAVEQSVGDYCRSPNVPSTCECGGEFKRNIKLKPSGVKGFLLLGDSGWERCEYTKYRSIK